MHNSEVDSKDVARILWTPVLNLSGRDPFLRLKEAALNHRATIPRANQEGNTASGWSAFRDGDCPSA